MVFMDEGIQNESIDRCLERIDDEIKLLELRERRAYKLIKKYTLKCSTCDKEFSCKLVERPTSRGEANDILLEQLEEHEKVHKVKESKTSSPNKEKPKNKISSRQQDNENKVSLPLIIGIVAVLLIGSGIIGFIFWRKRKT